jgi:hypothetical protein
LTTDEQRSLLGRLTAEFRTRAGADLNNELVAMASNPDIQRELRAIQDEFADTEQDGLENL